MPTELLWRVRRRLVPSYQALVRRIHQLDYLFVELTLDCNLRCLHCGSDCTRDAGKPRLDPGVLLGALAEIRGAYDSHRICVALVGGEPLCYPGLFELGRAIRELEFPWGMVTNGYAWSERTVEAAKRAGMQSITVSLDGLRDSHDWLRGRAGSFARATRTIGLLCADPFWQAMDVVTCVSPRNLAELDALYDLLAELGVRRWRLFSISPIGRAAGSPELRLSAPQYHQLLDAIARLRARGPIHLVLSESGYHGRHHELRVRDQLYFCRAGVNVAGIMSNGDILACPNIDRRFRQGNVHTDSFVDVWEHRFGELRDRSWMRQGKCRHCREWAMCQGNGLHLWDLDRGCTRLCHLDAYGLR
jgi:radical SAM protein with 4Fe4S-binding SPASM domain